MKVLHWNDEEAVLFRNNRQGVFSILTQLPDVSPIMHKVKEEGDKGLATLTRRYDGVRVSALRVDEAEIQQAAACIEDDLRQHLRQIGENVRKFALKQLDSCRSFQYEIHPGVLTRQDVIPIDRIGIYVPGGRYPLVSSLIMAAVPAQAAGVGQIAVCTPPGRTGAASPLILAAAHLLGLDEIYKVGGAQAVAALAFGTESIPKVDKIVGPGNSYVNAAKKWVYGLVGIDFIAGPSEVLILADEQADPVCLASDLIAQAEHDTQALAILVTDSLSVAGGVQSELERQLLAIKTKDVARRALEKNGAILIVTSWDEAIAYANQRAPEHLIINMKDPEDLIPRLRHYGTLFIGSLATVVLGDYSAGVNHILPTNRAARYTGGLSVRDFIKFQTSLHVDPGGFAEIAPPAEVLSQAEGLEGHAQACRNRRSTGSKNQL